MHTISRYLTYLIASGQIYVYIYIHESFSCINLNFIARISSKSNRILHLKLDQIDFKYKIISLLKQTQNESKVYTKFSKYIKYEGNYNGTIIKIFSINPNLSCVFHVKPFTCYEENGKGCHIIKFSQRM